ncbi:putative TetR family transcriptional regulator [Microlunatus phosphovorus NM-1]|uniref:Putative TetR family transcriptional regulator n=1 Tax=Microlunatus phosphovorus (strain ATCC 700054 / DSM 10555 / JCM 9379 / NBRC 101784 / NCIMB 13414 / VKM Ac-1990 / NM-1) TaxID=1032480 RepID=F5XEZ2_MICPN|nr:TetR/AcrR family transcriptional regulator [Microlunatus phosphovorus]BAK37730.1 putative TetR family transcriptional regulator [Microlunatus phosphovorus NM-1]
MESTFVTTGRLTTRQRQLVGELLELFLAEGFADLTLDDIAARLGCSKRTLYALADSKEQLAVRTVRYFFKQATEQVETAIARTRSPAARVTRYLEAVAAALRPAGTQFLRDVDRQAATREVYEQNTAAAAVRVRELIDEGIRTGAFRQVSAVFVGEVVTATMRRITSGELGQATELDDAQAYAELAKLVVAAISR